MTPEEILIENFVHLKLTAAFKIDNPKGILDMAKQVRLVVGEGDGKIEVGVATVEKTANEGAMVTLVISNPALIKALGGDQIKGIIPSFVEEEDKNE